uniref:Interferon-related developmental regulator N-terminal domain-containing protein n=1 Tax=Anopheles arabiensis TaxID=7173 RepID=A0A182HPW8_ANOAR
MPRNRKKPSPGDSQPIQRYCPGSLAGRKMSLVESVKRSLRKGNEEERLWAVSVIPLLALQSETCADVLELVETFKPVMIGILTDILEHVKSANLLSPRDLMAMLDSSHLDVRTASGETLALMHELLCQHDSSFLQEDLPDLLNTVRKLSTDAYRFQGKRGRKLQRITFRDVLLYLQEGVVPEMRIKFGDETLLLNSWMMHRRYDCLKDVLGMALNVHLEKNALVRDLLKLGLKWIGL